MLEEIFSFHLIHYLFLGTSLLQSGANSLDSVYAVSHVLKMAELPAFRAQLRVNDVPLLAPTNSSQRC